ncbi:ATP dependent RNA helicase [Niveomyces insectorum RCEF 264]|uniref:ATP-dependent RNA helicase n=1 Tax=Niveomyces insectorum RCEF 264 TaxID=1081102 RepID=A0A168A5W3_9HYPO|nr:ATP dependent RNA helicase [Niveomyces insectorum RCEF 264]
MADDGLILNFDLSNVPVNTQIKFKGGKWRDRNRAQRSVNRQQQPHVDGDAAPGDGKDRPMKRRRVEGGEGGARNESEGQPRKTWQQLASTRPDGATATDKTTATARTTGRPQNGVTSRLFTSNPVAVTDFAAEAARAAAADDDDAAPVQPSNAPLSDEASTFLALGLSRRIAQHLATKMDLKGPTAIQHNAIPQLVGHDSDAFLQAETGSGKTLAYLLPLVQRILALSEADDGSKRINGARIHRGSGLFAIVLAPTRELCKQIAVVLEKLLRCAPWIVSTTVTGGESKKAEKARIRKGVNILIATPGRLTDHLDHTEVLDVGTVRWLVLDEGDRLMEMGFEEDLRSIVGKIREHGLKKTSKDGVVLPDGVLPARRVTVLCSATMKMNVQKLGEISLEDAVHVTAAAGENGANGANGASGTDGKATDETAAFSAPSQLKQTYTVVPAKLRLITLLGLLRSTFARKGTVMKAIVFISCADAVDFHFDLLRSPDADADANANANSSANASANTDAKPEGIEVKATDNKEDAPPPQSKAALAAAASTASTVAPAAYITSRANRTIVLHKLHGSLPQAVRTATLASFAKETNPAVLLATDIASRGLDVPAVDLVVEYDPAFAVDDHVHRIGRTARAGRPGKAVLFLQPGCEEGYVTLLKPASTSALVPQLYDSVLQAGFASPVDLPAAFAAAVAADVAEGGTNLLPGEHDPSKPQSWTKRAEALQLHLEQRLLQPAAVVRPYEGKTNDADAADGQAGSTTTSPHKRKWDSKGRGGKDRGDSNRVQDSKLLDAARKAFRSHIRAYATHVREERVYFDITQLHLGHTAKSFGLREAPGGIGGGVQRRTRRPGHVAAGHGGSSSSGKGGQLHKGTSGTSGSGGGAFDDNDDDDDGGFGGGKAAADEAAARRRMREKMQAVMTAGCQFSDNFYPNINPDNMQNNCTVVAAAHMTCHASANDLWMNTYGRPLPDKPLNTAQVDRLLSYTGQKYKMNTFEASGNNTAYQNMVEHLPPGPAKVGVALYKRTNGSGHAVNMYDQRQGVSTAIGLPRGLFFHDFQHNDAGAVCTEIKRAEKIHTFLPDMGNLNADSIREEKARYLGPPGRQWWFSRNE